MKPRATFQRQPDGRWIAEIPDVPGGYAAGRSIDEARKALRDTLNASEDADDVEIREEISW